MRQPLRWRAQEGTRHVGEKGSELRGDVLGLGRLVPFQESQPGRHWHAGLKPGEQRIASFAKAWVGCTGGHPESGAPGKAQEPLLKAPAGQGA